jgi:arylsulfatase A-like enzyme
MIKAPGCVPGSTLPPGHVRDLAPTILALLGAPASKEMDGVVLLEHTSDVFR